MVHDQAAGFALHALAPDEAEAFERHLRSCKDCVQALEPLSATAAALAFAGELAAPPPGLRLRVLDVDRSAIPLRRRWRGAALGVVAVAAASAAIVLGVQRSTGSASLAAVRAYPLRGQASGGLLLLTGRGEAIVVARGLPALAPGTAYELWIVDDRVVVPAGFLRGRIGMLTKSVPNGATVAVSMEPTAGSHRPTGPLLLTGGTA